MCESALENFPTTSDDDNVAITNCHDDDAIEGARKKVYSLYNQ